MQTDVEYFSDARTVAAVIRNASIRSKEEYEARRSGVDARLPPDPENYYDQWERFGGWNGVTCRLGGMLTEIGPHNA